MRYLLFTLLLVSGLVNAQQFEGVVKWKATMEFTDPEMKAQVDNAAKQMADPAFQAQMAELKKQMDSNPQMKAMMESNPQMKVMMDRMASGNAANSQGVMPTGMIVKMKSGNVITSMEGGVLAGMDVLYLKDKDQSFNIDRQNKTYSAMSPVSSTSTQSNVKVTKTNQTAKILKYNCTLYIAEVTEKGRTITQNFWTTTEIKDWDLKALSQQRFNKNSSMYYDGMEGAPIKVEVSMPEGKMTMEVVELTKQSLKETDFTIPTDFKEVKGLY